MDFESVVDDKILVEKRKQLLREKIKDVFKVFDQKQTGTANSVDFTTMVCALDVNPTRKQLEEMAKSIKDDSETFIRYERFERLMMEVLISHEFGGHLLRKDPESTILAAFRFMDEEKKGFLTREEVREKLLKYGEGDFTEGEVEELLNYAVDPETDTIKYEDYAATLADE